VVEVTSEVNQENLLSLVVHKVHKHKEHKQQRLLSHLLLKKVVGSLSFNS
jgi:hypothetical protein